MPEMLTPTSAIMGAGLGKGYIMWPVCRIAGLHHLAFLQDCFSVVWLPEPDGKALAQCLWCGWSTRVSTWGCWPEVYANVKSIRTRGIPLGALQECALITDGRFSGGSHGFVIGHVSPEAQVGGPIGLVKVSLVTKEGAWEVT
eukprot:scaffold32254_cov21-Tisochrysis_lutea.AAC.1